MLYHERKEFLYDSELFKRADSTIALRLYDEYCKKNAPHPLPQFFEVDRTPGNVDHLWNMPTTERTQFTKRSPMGIYCINQFKKPDWRLKKSGQYPEQMDTFLISNIALQAIDYFPIRGDLVFWKGYRMMVTDSAPPPESYWQQTGVWLGLAVTAVIVPEGDARPIKDVSQPAPSEVSTAIPTPTLAPPPSASALPPRFRPRPEVCPR